VFSMIFAASATFKENVSDIRNSKIADVVNELQSFSVKVDVTDPCASSKELEQEYGFGLIPKIGNNYDAIIVAVNHKQYLDFDETYFQNISANKGVLIDIKGIYKGKIRQMQYWSL